MDAIAIMLFFGAATILVRFATRQDAHDDRIRDLEREVSRLRERVGKLLADKEEARRTNGD
jgi:hypothetical protein